MPKGARAEEPQVERPDPRGHRHLIMNVIRISTITNKHAINANDIISISLF